MDPNLSTVRARREQLAKQRDQIDTELKELEITERVLTRLAATTVSAWPVTTFSASPPRNGGGTVSAPAPVTHKDLVIATLRTHAEPWVESSRHLQEEIEKAHGIHIKDN